MRGLKETTHCYQDADVTFRIQIFFIYNDFPHFLEKLCFDSFTCDESSVEK